MTLIVYKDGIMAGDTGSWRGSIKTAEAIKVFKTPTGWLVGFAGDSNQIEILRAWMMDGMHGNPPKVKDCGALLVSPEGEKFHYATGLISTANSDNLAMGCGEEFVHGAMYSGLSAPEAIQLAIKHVAYVSGAVSTVSLDKKPKRKRRT